jgi:hypothetical protein
MAYDTRPATRDNGVESKRGTERIESTGEQREYRQDRIETLITRSTAMNHYPQSRRQPLIAVAAVVASAATLAMTVILPATMTVQPAHDTAVVAKREAPSAAAPVSLGRIEVVAQRLAPIVKTSSVTPTAMETTKPCPAPRGDQV